MKHFLFAIFVTSNAMLNARTGNLILESKHISFPEIIDKEVEKWGASQTNFNGLRKTGKELYITGPITAE